MELIAATSNACCNTRWRQARTQAWLLSCHENLPTYSVSQVMQTQQANNPINVSTDQSQVLRRHQQEVNVWLTSQRLMEVSGVWRIHFSVDIMLILTSIVHGLREIKTLWVCFNMWPILTYTLKWTSNATQLPQTVLTSLHSVLPLN